MGPNNPFIPPPTEANAVLIPVNKVVPRVANNAFNPPGLNRLPNDNPPIANFIDNISFNESNNPPPSSSFDSCQFRTLTSCTPALSFLALAASFLASVSLAATASCCNKVALP